MAEVESVRERQKRLGLGRSRWATPDPTYDATSVPAGVPLPKSVPVQGGAQDTGGPPKKYGPTGERES